MVYSPSLVLLDSLSPAMPPTPRRLVELVDECRLRSLVSPDEAMESFFTALPLLTTSLFFSLAVVASSS